MRILRRLNYLLHQRRSEADLAEEIEFHRTMNRESGGDPRAIGNTTRAREDARAVWIWPFLESVRQDASYAVRNLRRQPGFALIALLTVGTAIGLNTSLFTVFSRIALRPWPVTDAARVVRVVEDGYGFSLAEYRALASNSTLLTGLALKRDSLVHLGEADSNDLRSCTLVAGNYFGLLRVPMELGRGFLASEDRMDDPQAVAILSNTFWQENFGGDLQIVDKQIRIGGRAFTIVGVASRTFTLDGNMWLPLAAASLPLSDVAASAHAGLPDRTVCCVEVLGRLAPGVSVAAAQAELSTLSRGFRTRSGLRRATIHLNPAVSFSDSKVRMLPLFGLMNLAVMLVLLLTCANLGSLLLARAEARRPEIRIRFSLGASRGRIVRQLLTESFLLALAAATLGVGLAYRLPNLVLRQFHQEAPSPLAPDGAVLAYALGLAVLSCLCFGLAPALQGTQAAEDRRLRMRSILLAAEVAMTVVLLVGASLLTKAVARSRGLDPGFSVGDVTLLSFEFPAGAYDANGFHSRFTESLKIAKDLPVVGLAEREPLGSRTFNAGATTPFGWIELQSVSAGYFDVLRIPIVAGRPLKDGDEQRRAIVVNETMANRYWKGDAIAKRLKVGDNFREVVGIVRDTYSTRAGLDRVDPMIYQPIPGRRTAALGSRVVPKILFQSAPGVAERIAALVSAIDSRVQVRSEPLAESVDRWLEPARTGAAIAGALGVFALVLATIGMSGVFGYVVQRRTKEIGIRMALGAQPAQVVIPLLAGVSRSVSIGFAVGLLAAAPVSRLLQQRLSGVNPLDPAAYLPVAFALAIAALAAGYLPARRATRIEPMSALRSD